MFCQQTKPRARAQSLSSDDETKLEGETPLLRTRKNEVRYTALMDKHIQELIDNASKESKGISILNTAGELESFYLSNVDKYKSWRAMASIEDWLPVNPDFLQEFRKKLSENKVDTKVIFKESGLKYEVATLPHRQVKTVPDSYSFKSSVDILDDKILIMNPHQTVLGLVIESKVLVDVFIDMFDMLWTSLPERN